MSGYLPPHGKGGQCSELYTTDYALKKTDPTGGNIDDRAYYLHLPDDVIPTSKTLIGFGPSEDNQIIKIAPLGFGLWGWGDVLTYGWGPSNGYDQKLNDDSIRGAWQHIFDNLPHVLMDTAEHYGYTDGYSEKSVGRNLTSDPERRDQMAFATKYFPTPWRHPWKYPEIVQDCIRGSIERAQVGHVDIYQLHGPSHFGFWPTLDTLCESLARTYESGRSKSIGTCNLSYEQVHYVWSYLKKRNIPLVSNQVEFSLVRMDPWKTGLIEKCHKLGVATIAYSPLAVGRLTGKYSRTNPPRGNRNFGHVSWSKIQPIVDELVRIGRKEGKTPSAVALNWVICKGAVPIPTPKNKEQVEDNLQALGWRLDKEDERRLDEVGLVNAWDWNLLKHFQNWWWEQG